MVAVVIALTTVLMIMATANYSPSLTFYGSIVACQNLDAEARKPNGFGIHETQDDSTCVAVIFSVPEKYQHVLSSAKRADVYFAHHTETEVHVSPVQVAQYSRNGRSDKHVAELFSRIYVARVVPTNLSSSTERNKEISEYSARVVVTLPEEKLFRLFSPRFQPQEW